MRNPANGQVQGFTIIELLLVLAVIAVMAVVAVPAFDQSVERNEVTSQVMALQRGLALARSEAARRGGPVSVCQSADQAGCGGSWSAGWLVFFDPDGDGTVDAGEEVIRVGAGQEHTNVSMAGPVSTAFVLFSSNGFSNQSATWTVCPNSGGAGKARGLVVENSGLLRRTVDGDADGIHEGTGGPLTCP